MIDQAAIRLLIPHGGRMCLLDRVLDFDSFSIRCTASSHRDPDNPMVYAGQLGSVCGVEYAAQAMAAHGGLTAGMAGQPRVGYLASVRSLVLALDRLDNLEDDLLVEAKLLAGAKNQALYSFLVSHAGTHVLSGRMAIVNVDKAR